jgi:hypothetical protein
MPIDEMVLPEDISCVQDIPASAGVEVGHFCACGSGDADMASALSVAVD